MKKLLAIVLLSIFMASCSNDNPTNETITEQDYSTCINLITDLQTGTQTISTSGSYYFKFNYSSGIADIGVIDLYLPGNVSALSFELLNLKFSYDSNGTKTINVSSATPTLSGSALSGYTIENVSMYLMDRYLGSGEYIPIINLSMTVNGMYSVVVVQPVIIYFGSTVVTDQETGSSYTSDDPFYLVSFNPEYQTAEISVVNLMFTQTWAVGELDFSGLSYTLGMNGYSIECDDLIPTVSGVLNSSYEVTNLDCSATFANGGSLVFDCMGFHIQANLGFMP